MEIKPKKSFEDRFPTASVKLLVGSEEVKDKLLQTLSELEASEGVRSDAEAGRVTAENARVSAEKSRVSAENARKSAEQSRVSAESSRNTAEQSRVSSESDRVDAERLREDAEYNRVIKERERESAESSRSQAERTRGTNESARTTAENKRSSNETARKSAENVRLSNETTRINNENTRTINEAGRVSAEKNRVSAENARQVGYENWKEQVSEYSTRISNNAQEIRDVKKDLTTAPEMNGINQYTKTVNLVDRTSGDKVYPITTPDAVLDKDGHNIIQIIEKYWAAGSTESEVMYGVEWDVTVADPAMTRIGNMDLHRQLPLQNRMKGCLLDDNGEVVKYLNPTTWEGEVRDGSHGQVMVELPEHYRKFETDGKIRRAKISEYPLPGYDFVPKMYISAYEASVQRSTGKLASVRNTTADYRGGRNNAEWDGTYRSELGLPATHLSRIDFRTAARKRGSTSWNIYLYEAHKAISWLYLVEYANRDSQSAYNAMKDVNGFAQGGLWRGATYMTSHSSYNNYGAFIPCGVTDSLGNGTGIVTYDVLDANGGVHYAAPVPRYRGIENVFGHFEKIVDGLAISGKVFYATEDLTIFSETLEGYAMLAPYSSGGFIKDIVGGNNFDIVASAIGGGSSQYWCDQFILQGEKIVTVGGNGSNGVNAGLFCMSLYYNQGATRLCFKK